MNLVKKQEKLSPKEQQLMQLKAELRSCEQLLKQTEVLFHMTVDEHLIEARIYELKSLAKVQDHLISSIRQLMSVQNTETETETESVSV